MGEVFTLYFSQRIASTELDGTREPIPVRLLTRFVPWEGPLVGSQTHTMRGRQASLPPCRAVSADPVKRGNPRNPAGYGEPPVAALAPQLHYS